jgi:CRISPR-associated protein Csb1
VNLDLAQVRGYGLGEQAERLLIMLGLYKLRVLLEGNLRFRTACDLRVATDQIVATAPEGFSLPELARLSADLEAAVAACRDAMQARTAVFTGELKKGQSEEGGEDSEDENGE